MELNLLPTIQQAISSLLLTYEPEFLRFGHRLFLSLATIILAWHGIQMMFAREGLSYSMFDFAKLLLVGMVEQLLVDSKRARDTDTAALAMQIVTWRDGRAAANAFVAGSGDALRTWRQP